MNSLLEFLVAVLATNQLVEIWRHSHMEPVARLRARVQGSTRWWSALGFCAWCFSVWAGWSILVMLGAGNTVWASGLSEDASARALAGWFSDQSALSFFHALACLTIEAGFRFFGWAILLVVYGLAVSRAANLLQDLTRHVRPKHDDEEEDPSEADGSGGGTLA